MAPRRQLSCLPDEQEQNKRKMQTTVAVREKTPHTFKIQPLKQVPVEQRPGGSPLLNFDRPFAGPRLELPTLYQLLPDRAASTYAFDQLPDESPRVLRPGSPPPHKKRLQRKSSLKRATGTSNNSEESISGLALKTRDSVAGHRASLASLASVESSIECILAEACSDDHTPGSFLREPDLTYGTDNDNSGPLLIGTPFTSTPSSSSVRKVKSMHILDSPDISGLLQSTPDHLTRTSSLQRRARTKAFSVSSVSTASLSTSQSVEDVPIPDRKRHAIYADLGIQLNLPPDICHAPTSGNPRPSEQLLRMTPRRGSTIKNTPWHQYTRSEGLRSPKVNLDGLARPFSTSLKRNKPMATLPEIPCLPVLPLNPRRKMIVTARTREDAMPSRNPAKHPIIIELLRDLDAAILEWNSCLSPVSL